MINLQAALRQLDECIKDQDANSSIRQRAANLIIELIGSVTNKTCVVCGRQFAVMPPHKRSHREYCSCACSSRAYRDRKAMRANEAV